MIKGDGIIITNRKARRDYFIVDSLEAGIELKGAEVKSLREKRGNLNDSFARVIQQEVFLFNLHISPYAQSSLDTPDPLRTRKLLLRKTQIRRLTGQVSVGKHTLIPLKLYFKKGKVKVELALAKGKKQYDKRDAIKRREHEKQMQQAMRKRR